MRNIFLMLIFVIMLFAQYDIDHIITDVLNGSADSAFFYLPAIEQEYPNAASTLFLQGILESNGEKAMLIFVDIFNLHPTSDYGDDAVMKVAEYYYAAGLYVQSSEWLKKMPLYYSRSPHIERAVKLFLNSLIVSGHKDTAIFYSRVFQRQFPNLDVDGKINALISEHQHAITNSENNVKVNNPEIIDSSKQDKEEVNSGKFSLQTGAYGVKDNADLQKLNLIIGGFDARVKELYSNNKVLYAVRVGYFNSKTEAKKKGKEIKIKLALDSIVVANY